MKSVKDETVLVLLSRGPGVLVTGIYGKGTKVNEDIEVEQGNERND